MEKRKGSPPSMEELEAKYPGIFVDGNKLLEEQGINCLIIPASEQLSPEELQKRLHPENKK